MLFDSHAHLNDEKLINDIEDILENAKKNKVSKVVCVGYDKDSSLLAFELANQYDEIYCAIGLHPTEARRIDEDLSWIEEYINEPKVVAIGEIGLDYYWDKKYQETQKFIFEKQIELAIKYSKPIIVHMRDATKDTYETLKKYKNSNLTGVMHCYSGSLESMQQFLDLNMYISLAGPITFKNAVTAKEIAAAVPMEKLLVETDSPYLTPVPYRGKLNQPKNVLYVAKEIAKIKNIDFDVLARETFNNTCKLFKIDCQEVK